MQGHSNQELLVSCHQTAVPSKLLQGKSRVLPPFAFTESSGRCFTLRAGDLRLSIYTADALQQTLLPLGEVIFCNYDAPDTLLQDETSHS